MDNDVAAVGWFRFDFPVWLVVSRRKIESGGLLEAVRLFDTAEGSPYLPIFTDQDNADTVLQADLLDGHFALKIDTPKLLDAILSGLENDGVDDVGFDVTQRHDRRYGLYAIEAVRANLADRIERGE